MVVDDLLDALSVYGKRSLRLVVLMVDMHLNIAQQEATREQQRITSGILLLGIGSTFLITFFVLAQVLLALWFYDSGQNWFWIVVGLLTGDIVLGSILAMLGLRTLKGPYMAETVAQLAKTTAILTEDDDSRVTSRR